MKHSSAQEKECRNSFWKAYMMNGLRLRKHKTEENKKGRKDRGDHDHFWVYCVERSEARQKLGNTAPKKLHLTCNCLFTQ